MFIPFSPAEIERFNSKVDDSTGPYGCWNWLGARQKPIHRQLPYGFFHRTRTPGSSKKGRQLGAHRAAMMISLGTDIPIGLHVLHNCNNPGCVNPAHLRLGTHIQNTADRVMGGRTTTGRSTAGYPRRYLSDDEAVEVFHSDKSIFGLAEEYGVSSSTIQRVRRLGPDVFAYRTPDWFAAHNCLPSGYLPTNWQFEHQKVDG